MMTPNRLGNIGLRAQNLKPSDSENSVEFLLKVTLFHLLDNFEE
jgi:hypothetical protein